MNAPGKENGSFESQKRQRVDGTGHDHAEEKFVILNVGGTKFYTSKSTLLIEPESMLGQCSLGDFHWSPLFLMGGKVIFKNYSLNVLPQL